MKQQKDKEDRKTPTQIDNNLGSVLECSRVEYNTVEYSRLTQLFLLLTAQSPIFRENIGTKQ